MKKIIPLLLALVLCLALCACGVLEQSPDAGNLEYVHNGDGTCTVVGIGTCIDTEIVIPAEFEGSKVTGIGDCAFVGCDFTNITIPDTITSIGFGVFQNCDNLTNIVIPDGVNYIGICTFWSCDNLMNITVPDSIARIEPGAFHKTGYYANEDNWTDGVLYMGKHLIEAKEDISGVYTIKDGTLTIADSAFEDCLNLTSVTIPDSVTNIGWGSFEDCSNLTSITIPDSATNIGGGAFRGTAYYENEDNWVDGVLYIGRHLIEVKENASGAYSIKTGTVTIASWSFLNCIGITDITIPDSVSNIGGWTFSQCGLKNIYFSGTIEQWISISKGSDWDAETGNYTIYCTDGEIKK